MGGRMALAGVLVATGLIMAGLAVNNQVGAAWATISATPKPTANQAKR